MNSNIITKIKENVANWRNDNYRNDFSGVAEILKYQILNHPEVKSIKQDQEYQYRYLRKAQFEAIETYLYLRFVKKTPTITNLYKEYYKTPQEFCKALNINHIQQESF